MIFKFWKDIMGFAFAPLYISGGVAKTVAGVALPAIGFAVAGPIGAAVGGGLAGASSGQGIKGVLMGAASGYLGGKLASGGFGGFGSSLSNTGSSLANMFGGPTAYNAASNFTGANFVRSLGGIGGAGSFAGSSALQGIAGATTRGLSPSTTQFFQSTAASPSGIGNLASRISPLSGVATSVGGDAERIYQQYLQSQQPTTGVLTESLNAPNVGTGLSFNREGLGDFLLSAGGQYQDELAANQLSALQDASGQYRDEFAGHYSKVAKENLAKLDAGELPEPYLAALQRTADTVTRKLISQGHNPAESGYGREQLERTLVDQEAQFFANERSYNTALAGGASTMNAQMLALEGQLSQASTANVGTARTQTLKSLLNLGGLSTTPAAPSLNIKLT